jgi:hypothetical protein
MIASMVRAQEILDAHGAVTSIWQPVSGGDAGSLAFVAAYDDSISYGRTMDALNASADFQAFWADIMINPSATNLENYTINDLDPSEGLPTVPSKVIVTVTFKTRPGRLVDHLTRQGQARQHLERLGGRVRTVQTLGTAPGTVSTMIGFDDFTHYGEFGAKLAVDEQWASWYTELAADPPAEEVDSSVASLLELPA